MTWRPHIQLTVGKVVLTMLSLIVLGVLYHALASHYTPYTHQAYLQTNVSRIAPRITGQVKRIVATDNQSVQAGQLLFELDESPYRYRVDQLNARLAQTIGQIRAMERQLQAAEAGVQQAKANQAYTHLIFSQLNRLDAENAASRQQVDLARDRYTQAVAECLDAQAEADVTRAKLNAKIDNVNATIKAVEAELAEARWQLSQCRVCAPIDGTVTDLQLTVGTAINANTPVMTVVDTAHWWVVADLPENALARVKKNQPVELSVNMYPGTIYTGQVKHVQLGVSRGQGIPDGDLPLVEEPKHWIKIPQRFPVRIQPEPGLTRQRLMVGASARITIYTCGGPLAWIAGLWQRLVTYWDWLY